MDLHSTTEPKRRWLVMAVSDIREVYPSLFFRTSNGREIPINYMVPVFESRDDALDASEGLYKVLIVEEVPKN